MVSRLLRTSKSSAVAGGERSSKKKGNRHVQRTAQVEQPGSTDTVSALLVFLDLLADDPDRPAELFLAYAKQVAAQTHPGTDMDVDGAATGNLLLCASANT